MQKPAISQDLVRFPLRARQGGVMTRRGHTEGTIDLMQMAGLSPFGILCEVANPDGSMAKTPEIVAFGKLHNMPVLTIEDMVSYRIMMEENPHKSLFIKKQ